MWQKMDKDVLKITCDTQTFVNAKVIKYHGSNKVQSVIGEQGQAVKSRLGFAVWPSM